MSRKQRRYQPIKCHACGTKYSRHRTECPTCHPPLRRDDADKYAPAALARRFKGGK